MSFIGGPVVLTVLTGVVAAARFIRKHHRWAVYLLVTTGGGTLLNFELKRYFERARPSGEDAAARKWVLVSEWTYDGIDGRDRSRDLSFAPRSTMK